MGGLILILEQKLLFCSWAWALSVLELFLGLGFVWAWALPGLGLYLGLGFDRTWTLPRPRLYLGLEFVGICQGFAWDWTLPAWPYQLLKKSN